MNNYQYYMKMKDICEKKGRSLPDQRVFFAEAAKGFEKKAMELKVGDIVPINLEQKKLLSFYGLRTC